LIKARRGDVIFIGDEQAGRSAGIPSSSRAGRGKDEGGEEVFRGLTVDLNDSGDDRIKGVSLTKAFLS